MADTATTENSADLQVGGSSGQKRSGTDPRIWSIPGFFLFGSRRISIDKILVNGELFVPKNSINLKTGDKVTFLGENLGIFNSASFLNDSLGRPLKTNLKDSGSAESIFSFTVPDLSASVGKDAFFWLRLNSVVPQASRIIAPYLVYKEETVEEKEQRKRQVGETTEKLEQDQNTQPGGPSGLVLNSMGDTIGGVVGSVGGQGGSVAKSEASYSPRQPSFIRRDNQGALQDVVYDTEDISVGNEDVQTSQVLGSTSEVSTGGQVVSQGSTTVSGGTQNISSGGTVRASQTVGGGSTTTARQRATISSGQTGLGGGAGQTTVRSTAEISQTGNVSSGDGQSQVNEGVKINATFGQASEPQPSVAPSSEDTNVNENLQANVKVEGKQETSVNAGQKSSVNVASQGSQSQPESGKGNVSVEQQLNLNATTESAEPNLNSKIFESGTSGIPSTLKPPAGLGAMKSREVNLNQTLGRPIVGSSVLPQAPFKAEEQGFKNGGNEEEAEGSVSLYQQSENKPEMAEPLVLPNKNSGGKNIGASLASTSPDEVKFQKKSGAESKGSPIVSGVPIGSLNLKSEPKVGEAKQDGGKVSKLSDPGRENFRMPETQESQEGEQGSAFGSNEEPKKEFQDNKEDEQAQGSEQEEAENEEQPESGGGIGDAIQGAQEGAKLGENFGPEGAVIGAAIGAAASTKAGQEAIGLATGKLWWWGFGFSSATFFVGLDFLMGALIMNIYWYSHRKQPKIFPMKAWQKFITVFASVFPFFAIIFLLSLFMAVGCNYPSNKLGYKFTVVGAFIGEDCKYFDVSEQIKSTTPSTQTPTTNSPVAQPGFNPRGTSP